MKALGPLLVVLTLVSCGRVSSPNPPDPNPSTPTRGDILGLLDVTINSSTPGKPLEVRFLTGSELNSQTFDVQNPSSVIQVCNGSVSFVDDTSVTPPVRYFTGLFKFDNKLALSLTNLTFHAINTSSNTNGTAVLNIKTAGGTLLTDPLVAQRMRPTHAMTVGSSGATVNPSLAHMQAFTSSETAEVQAKFAAAFPTSSGKVLEYGYVAEKIGSGRTITANDGTPCDSGASSAQVAFSYAYPYQSGDTPSSLPFQFNLRFVLSVDSTTTTTQSLEEQNDDAGVLERARKLAGSTNPVPVRTFFGSSYLLGPRGNLCGSLSADPTVAGNRFAVDNRFPFSSVTPAPNSIFNAANSSLTATFPTPLASSAGMTVQGFYSGSRLSGFSSAGNTLTQSNTRAFLPNEEVEISLTPNIKSTSGLSLCPNVSRFRVRSSASELLFNRPLVTGGFASTDSFGPFNLAVGDMNNDGKLDVITTDNSSRVTVLINNGSGQLSAVANQFACISDDNAVALGDMNNDGNLDVVVACPNATRSVLVLLGNGSGGFGSVIEIANDSGILPLIKPTLGDINGDGNLDAVFANETSNSVQMMLGDGRGNLILSKPFNVGFISGAVTLGDLNRDGALDLLVGSTQTSSGGGNGFIKIFLGNGKGNFTPTIENAISIGNYPKVTSIVLADFNGDGSLDFTYNAVEVNTGEFVTFGTAGSINLQFSGQNFTVVGGTSFQIDFGPGSVAVGDINGDGKLDAVVVNNFTGDANKPTSAFVLLGDGNRNVSFSSEIPISGIARSVALGDMNGDGKLDVIVTDSESATLNVILNSNFGNALNFGDKSSDISIPSSATLTSSTTSSYTVEAWVKIPSSLPTTGNTLLRIISKNPNTVTNSGPIPYSLFVQSGKVGASVCVVSNCLPLVLLSSNTLNDNQWHHIAFVRDTTLKTLALIIDGVVNTTVTDSTTNFSLASNQNLIFGATGQNNGQAGFGGLLDEVRVWNVARAVSDIAADKNGALIPPYPAALVSYFKLEGSSGDFTPNEIPSSFAGNVLNFSFGDPWVLR